MRHGSEGEFFDITAPKCFFLRPMTTNNPRVNAGRASRTADEGKLVLHTNIGSSLPRAQCFGVPPRRMSDCDLMERGEGRGKGQIRLTWCGGTVPVREASRHEAIRPWNIRDRQVVGW
jgi:hypothetical protein